MMRWFGVLAPAAFIAATVSVPARAQTTSGELESGGLAPPPPMADPTPPETSATERELDTADEEDSGRGLEFIWLNGEIGYQGVGLQTFKANNLVDAQVIEENQDGLVFGGGLGVRLFVLTLGARFRLGHFDKWQLWTLGVEAGWRIPIGRFEPHFDVGVGYAALGSFSTGNVGAGFRSDGVEITGYDVRVGGGLDVYLSDTFSVGANVSGDMMFLARPGVDVSTAGQAPSSQEEVYARDGSGVGASLTTTLVVGLHF